MVLSGSATGTGKSLLMTIMVRSLKGCDKPSTKSCSESEASLVMSRGENLYGKHHSGEAFNEETNVLSRAILYSLVYICFQLRSSLILLNLQEVQTLT